MHLGSSSFGYGLDIGFGEVSAEDLSGHFLNGWYTDFEMALFANPGDQFSSLFRIVCLCLSYRRYSLS